MNYKLRFENRCDEEGCEYLKYEILDKHDAPTGCYIDFREDGTCDLYDLEVAPSSPPQAILDWFDGLTVDEVDGHMQAGMDASAQQQASVADSAEQTPSGDAFAAVEAVHTKRSGRSSVEGQ